MPTYRFQEVPLYGTKNIPCSGCGKKLRRQRKFTQTLNPFNKNSEGHPKTVKEIQSELSERIKTWQAEPETCRNCVS